MEFPRVSPFDARIRHLTRLENYSYQCPNCKHESSFTLDDIKSAHGIKKSNFSIDIQRIFDTSYPIKNSFQEFYFELQCTGCTSPVRIYFDAEENKRGRWEFFGSFVMELRCKN